MSYNIGPKIGIDGEKEFRDSIRALNAEYKALEAQTRALTAEYESNGDETKKLRVYSEQLEKQIDVQKRKMEQLEDAISKASRKYDDNSIEVNRLKGVLYDTQNTLTGLENELKDTRNQLENAADGVEEFEHSVEDAGDAALDFSDVLNANLISDLTMEGLEEIGEAVAEFAKGSLDAAADVNAAGSQFEQTFGDMEGTARKSLEKISDDTNIAVTRMQGDFTDIYAVTKAAGAESEEALDVAGRAMVVAADRAAYYDKSIEEVTEQLQSFLKGNYENDAALGISATETTRNAKANEMYAMSFEKLSEAQKVDVLLAMVEAGNKASGALGQAAREADSWANVQGELDEALAQMQATLGQPALEAAIPIIKDVTAAIYELIEVQDWKTLDNQMNHFVDTMEDADAQFESTTKEIESSAYAADWYAKRLKKLEDAGLDTVESQNEYAAIVEQLNSLIPDLNLTIDEQTGLIEQNAAALMADIEAWKQRAIAQALQDQMIQKVQAYADAQANVYNAEAQRLILEGEHAELMRQYEELTGSATIATNTQSNALLHNAEMYAYASMGTGELSGMYKFLGDSMALARDPALQLEQQIRENEIAQSRLDEEISASKETLEDYNAEIEDASDALALYETETANASLGQSEMAGKVQEVQTQLDALQTEYDEATVSARESIDSQIGLFDQLSSESKMSAQEIVDNWHSQRAAFDNYTANMEKAVDMGLDQVLVQQLSDGSEESMLILNELVSSTDTNIDAINEAFQGLSEAKDTTAKAMAEIRTGANAEMDKLTADAYSWGVDIVNGAAGSVNANAYKFRSAMASLASTGNTAFRNTMAIKSPSRVMIGNSEDTVDGAVVGVDRNIKKFEAAMANLAEAGDLAFLNERLAAAELYPSVVEMQASRPAASNQRAVNYGGFNIQIYQQPGEDANDLAYRVMDVIQTELMRKEASIGG